MSRNTVNRVHETDPANILYSGVDSLYFSFDAEVSDAIWQQLNEERDTARDLERQGLVHCPEWLHAQIHGTGARGGYRFLIETDKKWSMKLLRGVPHRPSIVVEMRAEELHTHPEGVLGALFSVFGYIGRVLFPEMTPHEVLNTFNLDTAKCSRLDLHCDWQGGWHPTYTEGEDRQFIKPGKVKWHPEVEGNTCTGYTFGRGAVMARIYNKTSQVAISHHDWYLQFIAAVWGEKYRPELPIWRVEFQLLREGMKGFRLYAHPESDDPDEIIAAELAAEDLPHIGSLRKALHWSQQVWRYMTSRWLRLVVPGEDENRARWEVHSTWKAIQQGFAPVTGLPPTEPEKLELVRQQRHSGYQRFLHRMQIGVISSIDALDMDMASVAMGWMEHMRRAAVMAAQQLDKRFDEVPEGDGRAVEVVRGMGARTDRAAKMKHVLDMMLGIFTSAGVVQLGERPVETVTDMIAEVLEPLEQIAQDKGGIISLLQEKRKKVFKVPVIGVA